MLRYILAFSCLLLFACKENAQQKTEATPEVITESKEVPIDTLFELMQGSFNSEKQAVADTSYFNISLHMYPIWEAEGRYLYVEQALSSTQDKPYRQRVYKLSELENGKISSEVYTLPNDSLWIGKWKTPQVFDSISPKDLLIRKGCAVILEPQKNGSFVGATKPYSCESTLRGATYATSVVKVFANRIESWDQGFDAEGNQVWGAVQGGYVFDRIK